MILAIIVATVTTVLLLLIIPTTRELMLGFIDLAGETFNDHAPTFATILLAIGVIIGLLVFMAGSWVALWASIGAMALSPMAGWIIGIGGLIGLFALGWLTRPLIAISIIAIVFGLCFPTLKGAMNRYGSATEEELATGLDSATLQKQPMGVMSGIMLEKAFIHNNSGNPTATIADEGVEFKTVSLERRQFPSGPETFVNIMLINATDTYINGSCGWVPVRSVKLGTTAKTEAQAKADAEAKAKAEATAQTKADQLAKEVAMAKALEETRLKVKKQERVKVSTFRQTKEVRELVIKDQSIPVTLYGKWRAEPADLEYQEVGCRKTPSNGTLGVVGMEKKYILTLPGNRPGTYRQGSIKLTKIG